MDEQEMLAAILAARSYRALCPDTVLRTIREMTGRYRNDQETLKAVKNKLHQIHGAFLTEADNARAGKLVVALPAGADMAALREACIPLLRLHASTAERLLGLTDFYRSIFAVTGLPGAILDVACGYNPFTIPWMGLPSPVRYDAVDINGQSTALLNGFFTKLNWPGRARTQDILCEVPGQPADVAFVFKALPVLEQQQPGSGRRLLSALPARWLVVTFPGRSLSGHNVGMDRHYAAYLNGALPGGCRVREQMSLAGESVYILEKREEP